jgi:hypothetical protein
MTLGYTHPLTETSTRNRKIILESRTRSVRKADNLMGYGILNISQHYRLPRPVAGIVFIFFFFYYLGSVFIRTSCNIIILILKFASSTHNFLGANIKIKAIVDY